MAALLALVHGGLLWLYWWPRHKLLWGDELEYLGSAQRLLDGSRDWWPAPLWPPLYPCFVAGTTVVANGSLFGLQIAQTLLLAIAAAILGDLVRRWSGDATAGLAAAVAMLGYPPLIAFAHSLWPEVLHLALLMIAIWLLAIRPLEPAAAALAGLAIGLALLTKSLLTPLVPLLMALMWLARPWRRAAACAAVFAAAVALTIAPVVMVQQQRTGRLMIADSSAFNLWVGLNDSARRNFEDAFVYQAWLSYLASGSDWQARDAFVRGEITRTLQGRSLFQVVRTQLGRQYFRLLDRDGYLLDQLPGGVATTGRHPVGYVAAPPWAATLVRWTCRALWGLLLAAGAIGLTLRPPGDARWRGALLGFVLYNAAIFLLLHVKTRYRVQLLPVLFIGVGGLVAWLRASHPPVSRPRLAIGVTTALVLLFFAYGGSLL